MTCSQICRLLAEKCQILCLGLCVAQNSVACLCDARATFLIFSSQINSTTAGIQTSYSFNIRELILVPVGKKNARVFSYGSIVKWCCVLVQNKEKYQGLFFYSVNLPLFRDMAL
jgi:hypothetical protein